MLSARAGNAVYASKMAHDPEGRPSGSSLDQDQRSHTLPAEAAAALTAACQEILRIRHPEYAGLVVEMARRPARAA
jgi:hypothetical protein